MGAADMSPAGVRLADLLHDGDDGDTVLEVEGRQFSRAELAASADELAAALADRGVGGGQVVASCLPSGAGIVAGLFGTWRRGASFAPLNPRLTDAELRSMADELAPAAVLVPAGEAHRAEALADRTILEVDARLGWHGARTGAAGSGGVDADIALVLYTSGTTAPPKPVLLRRPTLTSSMEAVVASIRSRPPAHGGTHRPPMPNLVAFPLYLWSGIYSMCFALLQHSPIVVLSPFDAGELARLVRDHGIRSVVLAPAMLAALVDSDVPDLAPLRFVRNGTASLPVTLAERFEDRFGIPVLNGYGQTELGGEVAGWTAADARTYGRAKRGAAGKPHPGVSIRIVDDAADEVPTGEDGEVLVRSPFAMAGYLGRGDRGRVTADGFVHTGDIGHVDEDGFLWLTGRRSDVINRSGLKVFPDQVEDVLRADPAVADVAVAARPDERVGEVPWAYVVLRDSHEGGPDTDERLRGVARQRLAAYKVPAGFTYVDRLPRNDIGKVLRRELAAGRHADSEGGSDDERPNRG
jgi:acyl-CoA synthetase (AMP-forming)/AMP-acid ligase II